ncbi:hypothetical protein PRIPAC_81558 [Pristionchus pacificus]|uniref:Uncharacterized protein n=1 Tax=Pristionchus pacificus TaxID=54126 RepID=A0A2A6BHY3_PRIPA|nr:hypothetical protein PRIPAC_81558 [Pristionchus pacificus]|eukprot:PDM65520.1 hypothetical protein PRIPAC_52462 [Pristionchus pacificus]
MEGRSGRGGKEEEEERDYNEGPSSRFDLGYGSCSLSWKAQRLPNIIQQQTQRVSRSLHRNSSHHDHQDHDMQFVICQD